MKVVSRFEAGLLRILQCILQRAPVAQAMPLVTAVRDRPPCLSRAAVELVQDYLSKGSVHLLARQGWRSERFLLGSEVRAGRLWERTAPTELALTFSGQALEFLVWLTAADPGEKKSAWCVRTEELTVADRLLCFWAYQLLRGNDAGKGLLRQEYYFQDPLCRLAYPDDYHKAPPAGVDWTPWVRGLGANLLEALQVPLEECLVQAEERKCRNRDSQRTRRMGSCQEEVLPSFVAALNGGGRWDLARFLLSALARILAGSPTAQRWIGNLDVSGLRLAERVETYPAAVVLLRQLEPLRTWQRQAQTIGYFDEGYAASQLWKEAWERYDGEELCRRAEVVLREIEPL